MHGVRLRPGSSLVELRVRLYNRTPLTQTFLWCVTGAGAGSCNSWLAALLGWNQATSGCQLHIMQTCHVSCKPPCPLHCRRWANAGVHVHDQYQSFFPPDVHYVAGKGLAISITCLAGFASVQLYECGTDGGMHGRLLRSRCTAASCNGCPASSSQPAPPWR